MAEKFQKMYLCISKDKEEKSVEMRKILRRLNIFALLYGFVGEVRRALYRCRLLKSVRFDNVAVVSIGNLSMGGTGKTPHTEFLISRLSAKYRTTILSRGYGRKSRGFVSTKELAAEHCSAETIGDEPLQMHLKFPDLEIAVCEKRKTGIEKLLQQKEPPELIILDDAYQHLQVAPDCHILLTEYAHPYSADFVVPAGRLREFPSAAKYADIIIVTKAPADLTIEERDSFIQKLKPCQGQDVFFSTIEYKAPKPVTAAAEQRTLTAETPVKLVTGIANPEPLLKQVCSQFKNVQHFKFGDHHTFTEKELNGIINYKFDKNSEESIIITTEKDISRLMSDNTKKIISLQPIFSFPIEMKILFEEEEKLINKIEKLCYKKSKKVQNS